MKFSRPQKQIKVLLEFGMNIGAECCQKCPCIREEYASKNHYCWMNRQDLPLWETHIGQRCPLRFITEEGEVITYESVMALASPEKEDKA